MSHRPFGTCFFEQYAQITLSTLLGSEFRSLVGRDRPDLQSADGHTLGIEVTRAMEQSKDAAAALMADISGITPDPEELSGGRFWTTDEIDKAMGKGILTPNFEGEYRRIKDALLALL